MLRGSFLGLITVGLIGSSAFFACGGSSDDNSAKGGGGGSSGKEGGAPDPEGAGKRPPTKGSGSPGTGSEETVVAIRKLFLGDTDPVSGTPDSTAWRKIGYNLDGLISTKTGTNHCKAQEGGTKSAIQTDGDEGIDNSFGSNLMPIISSLATDASATISESLENGDFTIMLRMKNLDSNPDQTDINSSLYGGAKFGSLNPVCDATPDDPSCAPKWDGTDSWPIVPELLTTPTDKDSAKLQFPTAYVSGGTWVSGSEGTLALTVSIQGFNLSLNITKAVITMKVAGTGGSATATDGVIAGVIPTEALISELKKVAGGFDKNLCEGATFESIAQQIRAASDIMQDGTNGDPSKTCDGISIGLGFAAHGVLLGDIAPAASAPEDPCAAGGTGGTGGGGTGGSGTGGSGTGGASTGGTGGASDASAD